MKKRRTVQGQKKTKYEGLRLHRSMKVRVVLLCRAVENIKRFIRNNIHEFVRHRNLETTGMMCVTVAGQ